MDESTADVQAYTAKCDHFGERKKSFRRNSIELTRIRTLREILGDVSVPKCNVYIRVTNIDENAVL